MENLGCLEIFKHDEVYISTGVFTFIEEVKTLGQQELAMKVFTTPNEKTRIEEKVYSALLP